MMESKKEPGASFLRSSVGIYALMCFHMLSRPKDVIEVDQLFDVIKNKIVTAKGACNNEQGVTNGSAGYLYVLLTLEK